LLNLSDDNICTQIPGGPGDFCFGILFLSLDGGHSILKRGCPYRPFVFCICQICDRIRFGIWLILSPGHIDIKMDNLWGLASGLFASFAIIYLNISRQIHDTNTVLFFMFGLGAILMFLLFHQRFFMPDATAFYYLALCGICGVAGQFLITVGFRFITAVEGGIISSMRIFIAAMLGPFIVGEAPLNTAGWIGALLLFTANAVLAVRHKH
jgi:drug/metabolite transporter (DMT)-like permease